MTSQEERDHIEPTVKEMVSISLFAVVLSVGTYQVLKQLFLWGVTAASWLAVTI